MKSPFNLPLLVSKFMFAGPSKKTSLACCWLFDYRFLFKTSAFYITFFANRNVFSHKEKIAKLFEKFAKKERIYFFHLNYKNCRTDKTRDKEIHTFIFNYIYNRNSNLNFFLRKFTLYGQKIPIIR